MPGLVRREVRGTFLSTDGGRLRGRVVFIPAVTVYDTAGNVVLMKRPIEANADRDGLVKVELPITDDPRHTPTGWYYLVVEQFEDGPSRDQYWLEVPAGSDPIELADAITDQVPPKPSYALIPGPQGEAATVEVGSTSVLNPSQNPTVTNSGTVNDAVLDFGLPRARQVTVGPTSTVNPTVNPSVASVEFGTGDRRLDFTLPRAASVTVGTVTTGLPGDPATVTNVGSNGDVVLNFGLPQGQQGPIGLTGDKGDQGDAATLDVGTVTQVNPDQPPDVTNSGTVNDAIFDFDLPRAPTFAVGTVTTVNPADPADVQDVGVDGDIVLDFDLPRGADGDGTAYYGQISSQTSQTVTISTAGAYVPMAITGTFDTANSFGTVGSGFGVENDSGFAQLFHVIATADVSIGNNKTAGLRLAVDGVAITETLCTATTGTQNFAKLISQWLVELNDGEVVSCQLVNLTDSGNITVQRAKIVLGTVGRQGEQGIQGVQGASGVVAATSPITYDSGTQTVAFDGGLSVLNDVTPGTPSDGDILRYDNSTGQWVSEQLPQGVSLGLVLALGG